MDECRNCPGGEWDEEDDYGAGMGEWIPCKCDCHKAKVKPSGK
jgi:hypothetical protein